MIGVALKAQNIASAALKLFILKHSCTYVLFTELAVL